jgi:hypothetical protein
MKTTILIAAAALSFQTFARADLITYAEQVTASGGLGANNFSNALVTISFSGDTSNVTNPFPGIFQNTQGVGTVAVAGIVGTATFTDMMGADDTQSINSAGISDFTLDRATLFTNDPAFATYDLTTAIGPLSGLGDTNLGFAFPTDMGSFVLLSLNSFVTFTATTTPEPVPEPASIILLGSLLCVVSRGIHKKYRGASNRT